MGCLTIVSVLLVVCARLGYSNPCETPCVEPPPPPPCVEPPPPPPCVEPPPPPPPCEEPSPSPPCEGGSVSVTVDIQVYAEVFSSCQYVEKTESEIYIKWFEKFSNEELTQIGYIVQYLQTQTALTGEIIDFTVFKEIIFSVYEILKSANIYTIEYADLSSQTAVFEQAKVKIVEALKVVSEQSQFYAILKYCETDVLVIPVCFGLFRSIILSQETYFVECSAAPPPSVEPPPPSPPCEEPSPSPPCEEPSPSPPCEEPSPSPPCEEPSPSPPCEEPSPSPPCEEPSPSPPCEKGSVSVTVDIQVYAEVFSSSQYVENTEGEIYIKWLEKFSNEELTQIGYIVQYLQTQTALTNEIIDFELFKQIIFSIYEVLKSANIYTIECVDLSSQTAVFEQVKAQLVEALKGVSEQSQLYTVLKYCETNVLVIPVCIGLYRSIILSQETYFSQSSTVVSASASASATASN